MRLSQNTLDRLSKSTSIRWLMKNVMSPIDSRLTGSSSAATLFGFDLPMCVLTTTGRRTGDPRAVQLMYVETGSGLPVVVATNFGGDRHPAWAYNLEADPHALLEIDGKSIAITARRVLEDEASPIWAQFESVWPGYEEYRSLTTRDIKMFVLDPSPD